MAIGYIGNSGPGMPSGFTSVCHSLVVSLTGVSGHRSYLTHVKTRLYVAPTVVLEYCSSRLVTVKLETVYSAP